MEEAAFLTAVDLKIENTPSAAIPVCNRNGFTSALRVFANEGNKGPARAHLGKHTQNIQKHLRSNSK